MWHRMKRYVRSVFPCRSVHAVCAVSNGRFEVRNGARQTFVLGNCRRHEAPIADIRPAIPAPIACGTKVVVATSYLGCGDSIKPVVVWSEAEAPAVPPSHRALRRAVSP